MAYVIIEQIKIFHNSPNEEGILGDNVRILVLLDVTADSVKITIENPGGTDIVDEQAMSLVASGSKVYEYVWQSLTTNQEGVYVIKISAVLDTETAIGQRLLTMVDQDDIEE